MSLPAAQRATSVLPLPMGAEGERCVLGCSPVRLDATARPAVLAHLLALDADDRYGRFGAGVPDAVIADYVGRIDFARDVCFAVVEPAGALSAFIHLAVAGGTAELGASVLVGWRGRGWARRLFAASLRAAALAGIREIHLAKGHPAARHICRSLRYTVVEQGGHPRAKVLLAARPPTPANAR